MDSQNSAGQQAAAEHWHRRIFEGRLGLFAVMTTVAILIGGLVEIVPMFTVKAGPEPLAGVTPYTPLEVAGRDIYIREGCYVCHSQMIRPMRAELLRYGEWSRAGEYAYDRPFLLGSRRIGPDLHRVGGKYPDAWHFEHMRDPRSTSPGSVMPTYQWLHRDAYDVADIAASVRALKRAGVPYTDAQLGGVPASVKAQSDSIVARLATANITTAPDREIVALIAYLQRLGRDGKAALAEPRPVAAAATPGATP
ncbi:MAG TPA: cytochrome-c oxidase, cbb3-type subunit II [Gemmatimonadaceae bacterium]|nr:cytochrome-c oxidase, cbb3-type subunit II [Gemmatimonadaceae bacterium]